MALLGSTIGLIYQIRGDTSHAERSISQLSSKVDREAANMGGSFRRGTVAAGAFSSAIGNLAADAVANLGQALLAGGKAVLDYSARIEQLKISLTTLTGSGAKATKLLEDIRQLSLQTPFEFEGLATLAQRLAGANVELSRIPGLVTDIGSIVAATGATTQERLEGVTVAITQMIQKGKVSAEEMEQLAERGIPAWNLLSEATGKTTAQLRKLAEDGKITADVMVVALQKMAREKFGDAMQKQANTFSGSMTIIKNAVMLASSQAFKPIYDEISRLTVKVAAGINKQKPQLGQIGFEIGKEMTAGIVRGFKSVEWSNAIKDYIRNVYAEIQSSGFFTTLGYLLGGAGGAAVVAGVKEAQNPVAPTPIVRAGAGASAMPDFSEQEALEKQRKARQDMLKKQAADLERFNSLQIEKARQSFEEFQNSAERLFESGEMSLQAYIAQSWRLIETYAADVQKAMQAAQAAAVVGLSGQELANQQLEYKNAVEKFNSEIQKLKENLYKQQETKTKESADKQIELLESEHRRRLALDAASASARLAQLDADRDKGIITEADYAKAVATIRLNSLELEKKLLKEQLAALEEKTERYADTANRIAIIDAQLSQQQIENARGVEEAVNNMADAYQQMLVDQRGEEGETDTWSGDTDPKRGSPRAGFLQQIFGGLDFGIQKMFEFGDVVKEIGGMVTDIFMEMGRAVGNMVQNWVLMGNQADMSMKKMVATILAGVAAQSATLSIFHLAMGIAALTPWGAAIYGSPFLHFKAAALWAGIAVGTALMGRAVAGNAFKNQTAEATGQNSSSGSGGRDGQGAAYSSQSDGTITQGRNTPAGALANSTITLKVDDRSGWFSKIFRTEWERNQSGIRTMIMQDLAKA